MAITVSGQLSALLLFPILCMVVVIAISNVMMKLDGSLSGSSSEDDSGQIYTSKKSLTMTQVSSYAFTNPPAPAAPVGTSDLYQNTGLLSYFPTATYNPDYYNPNDSIRIPFFHLYDNPVALDDYLQEYYRTNVKNMSWSSFQDSNYSLSIIPPTSAILFNEYSPAKLSYTTEPVTSVISESTYTFSPVSSIFSMEYQETPWRITSYINNAYLKTILGVDYFIDNSEIQSTTNPSFSFTTIVYIMGMFMFPTMFTFIFPVFVHNLVFERQQKLFQVMSMMGLRNSTYVLANHLFFVILYGIIATVMIIMGFAAQLAFFIQEPGKMILLIVLYGFSLVSMAFLFSAFFWKAKTSTIVSYIFVLVTPMIGSNLEMFVFHGEPAPLPYLFFPPFAFVHGLFAIFLKLNGTKGNYDYMISFSSYSELSRVCMALFVESIVFFFVGIYLANVIPKEYGVSYSPFYPIYSLKEWIGSLRRKSTDGESIGLLSSNSSINVNDDGEILEEDSDCRAEREKANSNNHYLLKSVNLKKVYKTGGRTKEALVNFCLTSNEGEILGLLGPNGAGKTTFIHIIGGMYNATSGEAFINRYPISTEMEKIYEHLGFCPQHDILYDDLTIQQHLVFYTQLKGIFNNKIDRDHHIDDILTKVKLEEHRDKRITQLSGGMKRRVSIAIALLGNNKLVLLDEPTTGLDPDARRAVWDIIQDVRHDKTILITTHAMDEADVLCNKIAIVAAGRLQCVGSPIYLKNRYGNGFKLDVVLNDNSTSQVIHDTVLGHFPTALPQEPVNDEICYLIPKGSDISIIFDEIARNKEAWGIKEWGVSQTSLEEIFMKMVEREEVF
eukprot:gene3606-4130_t